MNTFDLNSALNGSKVVTRLGNDVKVICVSRGKVVANVYSHSKMKAPVQIKYNLDGSRYNKNIEHHEDLFMA